MTLGIDLLREWDAHAGKHSCFYESAQNDGMEQCPRDARNLREFLERRDYPVDSLVDSTKFFGRNLDEPGYDIVNHRHEYGTKERPLTVRELRERGRANRGIQYRTTTDAVLRERAEAATNEPVENKQSPEELTVLFIGRQFQHQSEYLSAISTVLLTVDEKLTQVLTDIDSLSATVGRIEDAYASRSIRPQAEDIIGGIEVREPDYGNGPVE